jgi:hypothetical protein
MKMVNLPAVGLMAFLKKEPRSYLGKVMHKEFAIDPTLLCTFDRVRAILDSCGWHKGKVVCEYPKRHWKRMVYDSCNQVGDKEKKKIEQLLLSPIFVRRLNPAPYDKERGWLASIIQEHTRKSFSAILGNGENSHPDVVDGQYVTDEEPKWQASPGVIIRQAEEFGKVTSLLAQNSSRIVFVDPHFDFAAPRYVNSLSAMLETTIEEHYKRSPNEGHDGITIELHLKVKKSASNTDTYENIASRLHHNIERQLPRSILAGIRIDIYLWKEKDENTQMFHNRYFITNIAGISFGIGLDIDDSQPDATTGQTDDTFRMTPDQHKVPLAQFCAGSTAFQALGTFNILGTKR